MSPSRSKSKDKRAAGKDPLKSSAKPTTNANTVGGVPASGYNPLLGTFHTLETVPVSSVPPVHVNGRFRDIDDHSGNSVGTGVEYDCVSNNGSWSGESEDPKEKTSQGPSRQEAVPGVDSDKQEKIRQKNEKKHQRQKERRAQELHERCCGYIMSRKLEVLAQQLVAMGFPYDDATMALIMNEGKVEESVAWLLEGGEDADKQKECNRGEGVNLKVDISQELAQIVEMEIKFKCSKQEVERAVVACEGDLKRVAENLMKVQKQESQAVPSKPQETGDPPIVGTGARPSVVVSHIPSKVQSKHTSSAGVRPIQQRDDSEDMNHTNMGVNAGRPSAEPGSKHIQLLKKVQPNMDRAKQQLAVASPSVEKRLSVPLSPAVSYLLSSPLQAAPPPSKTETQYASIGNDFKNLQLGSVREPVIMMQRPQSKHILTTSMGSASSSASHVADWNSNGVVEPVMDMNPNGFPYIPSTTRSFNAPSYGSSISNQLHDQFHYQHHQQKQYVSSSSMLHPHASQPVATNDLNSNGMWNRIVGTTPTLAAASSLGLFSGLGSNGTSGASHVDWNGDWPSQFDYTNIDWSLNQVPLPGPPGSSSLRPNGMWMNSGSSSGADLSVLGRGGMRPTTSIVANRNSGVSIGLHPDGAVAETSGGEWTSPFEEKDLFSLPRQFVSSPSLSSGRESLKRIR